MSGGQRAQARSQIREVRQRPCREEIVDEGQRRLQAASERRVVHRTDERIEPDESMTASLKTRYLLAELPRIAPIPPIGHEHDDRASMQDSATPAAIELSKSGADSRASGPIRHRSRQGGDSRIELPRAQLHGDAGQSRRKEKRFDAAVPAGHGVGEMKEHARVAFHRSADVTHQHQRARATTALACWQGHDLAAGT